MRHPMYRKDPTGASMGEQVLGASEGAGRIYAAGKTVYDVGRALGGVARLASPLLALA